MKVFITGVSKGLGRELAEYYLAKGHNVTGIGRTHSIVNQNFNFLNCDLNSIEEIERLNFGTISEEVLFINNAGIIGNIQRLSDQDHPDVKDVMTVNAIAPMLLCAKIARSVDPENLLTIVNISSGAGRRAIPSWASYCASKAALDLFSETFYLEEIEKGRKIRVYSIAPGVIDTSMQEKIRHSSNKDFSGLQRFIELKSNSELKQTKTVVKEIDALISETSFDENVIRSL